MAGDDWFEWENDSHLFEVISQRSKNSQMTVKRRTALKITNKFYVGSRSVVPGGSNSKWAKRTLPEAIEHAKELCESSGEEQIVVKIIKIVRPQKVPLVIEDVK